MLDPVAMPHLADIPRVQGKALPDKPAFWFEGETTTFAQLDTRANQVANGLVALDVSPGDRVAYLGKNMAVYYELLFGCAKARAAMTGINNRLAPPEMQFILSDSRSEVLFVAKEFYGAVEKIAELCPDLKKIIAIDGGHDTWEAYAYWLSVQNENAPGIVTQDDDDVIQLYTSGTTGLPKGVLLTNACYNAVFHEAAKLDWSAYDEGDVVMNAMPLFHVAGCNIGILATAQGAKTVILREIDPAAILDLVEEHKVNHTFWVPAVILMLSQMPGVDDRDFSSLKTISYGASPIAEDLLKRAVDLFGAKFTQLYGLTETVGLGTYLPPEAHDPSWNKLRSCGVPYPGSVVRVVDPDENPVPQGEVGEIVIKGGYVMKGYWDREEATEEALRGGFFHTGDAGYFDEDGFLFIHDRIKDMIVSGGENVYPAEVENALFSHPDVADVAVIGIPSEKWGEEIKAIIVLKEGAEGDADAIIAWMKEKIASYKCPKSIDFIEALPRNPSGKILRKDLREPYWDGVERRVS
ncbi:long-chain-fatty-acid--CoA ligase [Henriciella aquimarina]|uniref:long-chain-fatty-acid--CoA ligase n=1 Tax=Henriciella aquimarina TaxID=545261 RepID=UPI0009FCD5AD|nr:long-chain-fatty-acid--CoA ligase [Henriciella aquimarina]